MNQYPPAVQRAIDRNYTFDFSAYIGRGFDLVGKQLVLFCAFSIVLFVGSGVIGEVPHAGDFLSYVLTSVMAAGYFLAARRVSEGKPLTFGYFFKGFDHLVEIGKATLIQYVFILPLNYLVVYITTGRLSYDLTIDLGIGNWAYLLLIPIVYLLVSWSMSTYLIVLHGMKAWDALEASRKIVSKNFFPFLLFFLVTGLITALGLIALVVGVFFTFAATMAASYAAFNDIVPVTEAGEEADILSHFVE